MQAPTIIRLYKRRRNFTKFRRSFRSAINRSYYAMFYSVLALICKKGMGTSKHTGVLSIFDREYVKHEIFPKEMSKLFHQAFYLRQQCDYEEFTLISKEETIEILDGAKNFLEKIKKHLALQEEE
ncbi:MAG TPA: HEPN domain-containing protein [Candidatus Kapabacteria bacterium]|nr:HEPN domain-containing protein [Candidatus Kapabacteria bacterium]